MRQPTTYPGSLATLPHLKSPTVQELAERLGSWLSLSLLFCLTGIFRGRLR